ncbi:hypothetical protein V6N13_104751 [Hibiscus sabdariffa]|uniref:Secreted protein n=2 Tax=Hibiscus sabdariffa TaxID=183260 RepID=A0ABR2SID0_9ROSI
MLATVVVWPCLVVLVVVVLAQQPTGWCIPMVSFCSVPGVARHDACSLPSLRTIRGPGWCTTCMCPRIFAWPLVGPTFRVSLYASNDALFFMAASSCRGRSGKIRVPFPDARHALALSPHCLVVGNGTRHLPIMEPVLAYLVCAGPHWLTTGPRGTSYSRYWHRLCMPWDVPLPFSWDRRGPCLVRQGPTASAPLLIGTWRRVAPTHPSSASRTVDLPRPLLTAVSALPAMVLSHGADRGPCSQPLLPGQPGP